MASPALDDDQIRQIVDSISQALSDELASITLPPPELRTPPSLVVSLRAIIGAANQAEALESLLTGASSFGARAALFVIKQDAAHGWRGAGFAPGEDGHDPVSGSVLSKDEPAVRAALEGEAVSCGDAQPDQVRAPDFGQGLPPEARLEPIQVRDKVLGLLYTDRASDESGWDPAAIEALVRVTEVTVERLALSRSAPHAGPARTAPSAQQQPASSPPPATETHAAGADTSDGSEDSALEDARRFARLLMEELLLYYESDVEAGRQAQDIEERLGDRIEEARKMFDQRYADALDDHAAVFRSAMVEVLAAGKPEALGSSSNATP